MTWAVLLLGFSAGGLCGCVTPDFLPAIVVGSTTIASVAVIGRSPVDALYSLVSGKDCSVVRLDEGKSYCRPVDLPPQPPAFCTRTLGSVNCWADPAVLPDHPTPVADGAAALTPAQEQYRLRTWP